MSCGPGYLERFGLVNVPVGLYSATQDHQVRFHQFQRGTSSLIKNKCVNGIATFVMRSKQYPTAIRPQLPTGSRCGGRTSTWPSTRRS